MLKWTWLQQTTARLRRRGIRITNGARPCGEISGPDTDDTGKQRERKGSALILTLILTLGLASLATSAIYVGGNSSVLADTFSRERDLRYAAEAMLAMGKSRLNFDPYAIPDTGAYRTVVQDAPVTGADGSAVPNVTASMYVGRTSSRTGQFGTFASVVAVAKNNTGAQVVRRLELAQESFAKFAYFSNKETNGNYIIYFNNNDQLWGPVWSNDVINIGTNGGAHFHDAVGTAKTVSGASNGTFDAGYSQNQNPITLPQPTNLAYLSSYAAAGNLSFTTPSNSSGVNQVMRRIEFVARDLDGNGKLDGPDEGFLRVYTASTTAGPGWLRGDFSWDNCGSRYVFTRPSSSATDTLFVPLSEHRSTWFSNALQQSGYSAKTIASLTQDVISKKPNDIRANVMTQPWARCFLGGDPNLRAANMRGTTAYTSAKVAGNQGTDAARLLGGNDTTFTSGGSLGSWLAWPGPVASSVQAKWPNEAPYLFPLYRGLNTGTKGVIYAGGTVGVSGLLRGRITLYATGNVVVLDDLKYVTDPALNLCRDILGVISGNNIMVADNALNDPPMADSTDATTRRNVDDTKDLFLHAVMMALNTSFGAENFSSGALTTNGCGSEVVGRGCLFLTGGVIQEQRGPVGQNQSGGATGYVKQYSYDRCAQYNPPPYFPTTGRYTDNRYYELDPMGFNVATLFKTLTAGP